MPWLNQPDTYLGIETDELSEYQDFTKGLIGASVVTYHNPRGSVAWAREVLRRSAMARRGGHSRSPRYDYFVVTDDNAIHRSEDALHKLVRACAEWPELCVMAGMHSTAMHIDRGKIGKKKTICGLTSYPAVAAIFQCYPRELYADYCYPEDAFGLDDRHYFLWLLDRGNTEFRVCMDAPFTKSRYQAGGQGSLNERAEKCGRAIARLAGDFPALVGATGTLRLPWQHLIHTVQAGGTITGNRLVGGAMRKEKDLQHKRLTIRRKTSPQSQRR